MLRWTALDKITLPSGWIHAVSYPHCSLSASQVHIALTKLSLEACTTTAEGFANTGVDAFCKRAASCSTVQQHIWQHCNDAKEIQQQMQLTRNTLTPPLLPPCVLSRCTFVRSNLLMEFSNRDNCGAVTYKVITHLRLPMC